MKFDKTAIIYAKPGYQVAFHKPKYDKAVGLRMLIGPDPTGPLGGRSGNVVAGSATKVFTKYALCAELIEVELNSYLGSLRRPVKLEVSWTLWGGKFHVQILEANKGLK